MTDAPTPMDVAIKVAMRSALTGLDGAIITRGMLADFHAALLSAGYVVVPREPTEVMIGAGSETLNLDRAIVGEPPAHLLFLSDGATGCYRAMIAAASPLPAGPIAEGDGT